MTMLATRFTTRYISTPMHAVDTMNWQDNQPKRDQDGQLCRETPLVMVPSDICCCCWVIVPRGFCAIVASYGEYVGQWRAGFHWCPPWVGITHLVPQCRFVYDTPVKECPTADNVMVTIDVTLLCHVMDAEQHIKNFAYKCGPEPLNQMLKAFQEDEVRGMARKRRYDEIYDLMDANQDKQLQNVKAGLNAKFNDYGFEVIGIAVTNVHLPRDFASNLSETTVWGTKNDYEQLKQEYEILTIEHDERERKQKQLKKEELELLESGLKHHLANEQATLAKIKAETSKILAMIREEQKAQVLSINADGDLEVAQIKAKEKMELDILVSTGQAESEKIKVEQSVYTVQAVANADEVCAGNSAKVIQLEAEAEGVAAEQLAPKREYDLKMNNLQVLKSMANNRQVAISGNNTDNMVAQLLSSQRGGSVMGLNLQ